MATRVKEKKRLPTKKSARARVLPLVPVPSRGEQALYLYGVSPPAAQGPALKMLGVDGQHGVEGIQCGGFLCWVTPVDAHEFAAELARKMEELEWLAESSVRHQRIVSAITERMTVLPARFGTIFLSEKSLDDDVRARAKTLASAFLRVKDADEWGVKVFLTAPAKAALISAKSGKDYLKKKAEAIAAARSAGPDVEIEKLSSALGKLARGQTASNKVSSGQQGLQWQSSYLLPRSKRKQWDAALLKYAKRWADKRRIESSGPWPPYSFVE